jgi:hypothetical protein
MPSFPKLVISYAVTAAILLAALAVLAPHQHAYAGAVTPHIGGAR